MIISDCILAAIVKSQLVPVEISALSSSGFAIDIPDDVSEGTRWRFTCNVTSEDDDQTSDWEYRWTNSIDDDWEVLTQVLDITVREAMLLTYCTYKFLKTVTSVPTKLFSLQYF